MKAKRRILRIAGMLLVSLIIIVAFTSCNPGNADVTAADTTTEAPPEPLVLLDGGEFKFKIVSGSAKADDAALAVYTRLVKDLKEACAVSTIKTGTDRSPDDETYEILFGYTSYQATKDVFGSIGFNEYAVAVQGNKIVIAGYNSDALYAATADFVDYVKENNKDGKVDIPYDLRLTGSAKSSAFPIVFSGEVPSFDGFEKASFSECGDNMEQITLTKTSFDRFDAYKKKLSGEGYLLYSENKIGGASFATYHKNNLTIHTYYTENSQETRIVVGKKLLLPAVSDVKYEKKCEPTFTLLGCAAGSSSNAGGLGCLIGLEDGTFIVIDGGYNTAVEARLLYSKLAELSPDKNNIVIRAWFITHAHSDHYGNLIAFSKNYSSNEKITVESFIYNFCDTKEQTQYSSSGSFSSVVSTVEKYWPSSDVYKCLTGQVYKFAGCEMEVLYCMSDFLPKVIGEEMSDADLTKVDGNIQNVTVRFKIAGQTLMVTGDASKVNVDEMCARYGEELKSDIMTVPHHGHNENRYRARNGTAEFYKLVDPSVVMWPASDSDFLKRSKWDGSVGGNFEANYYLLNLLNVKETFVAGDTHTTINLPYTAK